MISRRLSGIPFVIAGLALLALAVLVSVWRDHPVAAAVPAATGALAAPTQVAAAQAAHKQAPDAVWTDIATFPAVVLSPTPGANPLKIKRAAAASYFPNGKVYLLGGRHGVDGEDVALHFIYEYDPGANTWTQKTAQLDPGSQGSVWTSNMAAAVLTNANGVRIYAVGGSSINSETTPTTRVYDPVADSLTTDDPWPASPQRVAGGWAVYNNVLYIFGGYSRVSNGGVGGVFTDTWKFDPSQPAGSRWSQLPTGNLNLGRGFMAGAEVDGYIYAIGGDLWDPVSHLLIPVTNVERMDVRQANPTWQVVASLPTARGDMGAWAYDTGYPSSIAGMIAVDGGHFDVPDAQGYLYNPGSNSWSTFPNFVHATRNYGTAQLNGILYALGGYDYSNNTPSGANFNQAYDASGPAATATPTRTGTPPTATRTVTPGGPTNTPTRTSTAPPATATPCSAGISNGGFETGTLTPWTVLGTNPAPVVSNALAHTGTYSALLGTLSGPEPNGDGSMYQTITVPAGGGTLSYWWNGQTTDSITFDWQDAYITDTSGTILTTIMHNCDTTGAWLNQTFNMAPYAGQTVRVEFLVHQDGFGDDTSMYVDDVQLLTACATGTPATATSTVTPVAPSSTPTVIVPTDTPPPTSTSGVPPTNTVPPSNTPIVPPSNTPVVPPSNTPIVPPSDTPIAPPTNTQVPQATATPCVVSFSDVHPTDYFYTPVQYLACHGVVSGYADGTFRPYYDTTRAQMVKIVVLGFQLPINTPATGYTFTDVPRSNPFFAYVETAAAASIVSGYTCGGPGEPCDPQNRNYFRPYASVTRGQLSKIDVTAAGWALQNPATGSFEDVAPGSAFYEYVETAYCHNIISGYSCGGVGEPCDPQSRPYFRENANASRGQIAKIVYLSLGSGAACGVAP